MLLSTLTVLRGVSVFFPLRLGRLLTKETVVGSTEIIRHMQPTQHVVEVRVREAEADEQERLGN
ncbi:hypothetical protein D3C81_1737540 [compost metagenome]